MLAVTAEWAARLDDADGRRSDLAIAANRLLAARFCAGRGLADLARPIAEPAAPELAGFGAPLGRAELDNALRSAPIEVLGQAYEQWIGVAGQGRSRKRDGVYYSKPIADGIYVSIGASAFPSFLLIISAIATTMAGHAATRPRGR